MPKTPSATPSRPQDQETPEAPDPVPEAPTQAAPESAEGSDTPGVVAPPPLIYFAFFVVGAGLESAWPTPDLPGAWALASALAALAVTAALVVAARLRFREAGTNVQPSKPATALVTGGIYARTRNPMYLALAVGHAGLALGLGLLWAVAALGPALAVIHFGVIRREERYLEGKFGESYIRYRADVRRWL